MYKYRSKSNKEHQNRVRRNQYHRHRAVCDQIRWDINYQNVNQFDTSYYRKELLYVFRKCMYIHVSTFLLLRLSRTFHLRGKHVQTSWRTSDGVNAYKMCVNRPSIRGSFYTNQLSMFCFYRSKLNVKSSTFLNYFSYFYDVTE